MTLALLSFLAIVLLAPRLVLDGLQGKEVQYIAQRFDTRQALTHAALFATLFEHWNAPSQPLPALGILKAGGVLTQFG